MIVAVAALLATQVLRLDLLGDGRLDTVTLTQGHAGAIVRVSFPEAVHPAQTFHFVVSGDEDGLCTLPVHLETEKGGFVLRDGECDSFHFRWDRHARKLTWWRL